MITTKSTATLLAAALLPLGIAASASAAHVDFYDAGPFSLAANAGETRVHMQNVPAGASGALGGQRIVQIVNPGDGGVSPITASLDVDSPDVNDDAVDISFADPGTVTFNYGSFTDNFSNLFASTAGPLNADFLNIPNDDGSDSGRNWTRLEVDFNDNTDSIDGDGDGDIDVEDGLVGGTATVTITSGSSTASLSQTIDSEDGTLMFDYDDFAAQAPGLDFTDIDGAQLQISGDAGDAYSIAFFNRGGNVPDSVTPVIPSPAALPAGMALLAGLALRRRRQS